MLGIYEVLEMYAAAKSAAKSLQSCPTLCDPVDGSPPGSSIHGILQARVLEWGAIAFSVRNVYVLGKEHFPCPKQKQKTVSLEACESAR